MKLEKWPVINIFLLQQNFRLINATLSLFFHPNYKLTKGLPGTMKTTAIVLAKVTVTFPLKN